MSAFGNELRRLRRLRMLTQQKLATASSVAVTTISELERGVSQLPHPDTVRRLAGALGLAGAELAGFEFAARAAELDWSEQPPVALPAGDRTAGRRRGRAHLTAGVAAAVRTLPRDIGSFTGREQELTELLNAAGSGPQRSIWVVDGMSGVGKTAFAVHAAHRLAERFPDGQIYLELRGHVPGHAPADPADALTSLLQTVGVDVRQIPRGVQERARLWRARLAGKSLLLLLDDAIDSEQVRQLLPGTAECLVLVTSRSRLTALEDVRVITLTTLPPGEAALLLVRLAARDDLSPGDPAVKEIAELCGCLPLAVGILAARLRHHRAWTATWLSAELGAARSRTDLMETGDKSVSAAFTLSYKDLAHDEQQLFRRLGIHPGTDIDSYAASALDGTTLAATRRRLDVLYTRHLLSEPTPGRYRLHDLLREHARDLAGSDQPAARATALSRLLDYYLRTARAADCYFTPWPQAAFDGGDTSAETPPLSTRQQAAEWMEAERANLHAAALAALEGSPAYAAAIPAAMNAFLCNKEHWDQARALSQCALEAARLTQDRHAQATALADLATVERLTGDLPAAVTDSKRAIRLYRAVGDRAGEGRVLAHLGWIQYLTDDIAAAPASLAAALELCGASGDKAGQGRALTHLGYVSYLTGDIQAAISHLSRGQELCHATGDSAGEGSALFYLGIVHINTGHVPAATVTLAQARKLYRAFGGHSDEAWVVAYLGYCQIVTGMLATAVDNLGQALETFHTLGNQYGKATVLNYLGLALRLAGDLPDAAARQEESLRLYRSQRSQAGESNALRELGILQQLAGDIEAAYASQVQALGLCVSANDREGETECRNNMGDLFLGSDPSRARDNYQHALQVARTITVPLEEARAMEGISRCDLHDGQPDQAVAHLRQALMIYQRLGSPAAKTVEALLHETPGQE
jgi:tetratricopeptide (TPR) repeat protein/transcriptional regulator with XRE-family HTH domain